jgi:hypothetical protein
VNLSSAAHRRLDNGTVSASDHENIVALDEILSQQRYQTAA